MSAARRLQGVLTVSSWAPRTVWVASLATVTLLGFAEVLAPSMFPLLLVPLALGGWFGGRDLSAGVASLAVSSVLFSASSVPTLGPTDVAVQVLVLVLVAIAVPWLRDDVEETSSSAQLQAIRGLLMRAPARQLVPVTDRRPSGARGWQTAAVHVHVFSRASARS